MPDEDGSQKTETVPETSLHAYADGRVEDADPGSGGITGQNGLADGSSYTDGGHPDHAEFGETPAATRAPAAASTAAGGDPQFVDRTARPTPTPAARRAALRPPEPGDRGSSGACSSRGAMSIEDRALDESALTLAISAAIAALYAEFYSHVRATATTYINDNIVVCVLENILTEDEDTLIAQGAQDAVIDGRVAFQTDTEDEFTAVIERLTHRRVVAFLSSNQTAPGVACELFFLDAPALALAATGAA